MILSELWDLSHQFVDRNGAILTSGKIFVYYRGRTDLATTYSDLGGTSINPNPILLDNNGRATCYAPVNYTYTLKVTDFYGNILFSVDKELKAGLDLGRDLTIVNTDGTLDITSSTTELGKEYDIGANMDILASKQSVDTLSTQLSDHISEFDSWVEAVEEDMATEARTRRDADNALSQAINTYGLLMRSDGVNTLRFYRPNI